MVKYVKYIKIVLSSVVLILVYVILHNLHREGLIPFNVLNNIYTRTGVSILFGLIFYFIVSNSIANLILSTISKTEEKLSVMNLKELAFSIIGAIIGLSIANLVGLAFRGVGILGTIIVVSLNIVLCFLGVRVANRKKDEVNVKEIKNALLPVLAENNNANISITYGCPKILDTSVIIDGRILEILKTGFIEGEIIIPNFVLNELRHIADSSDDLKRKRGRRGLDILNEIQKQLAVPVHIKDYSIIENMEVDAMLLKMAEEMDAFVVTNDFNLNKVAEFQGVKILNINELANVVKPIVLPGEEMEVNITKMGKEAGQGLAYLNDGTMIVVEGGNKYIGEDRVVVVTSVLQTSAGRMIFAKILI